MQKQSQLHIQTLNLNQAAEFLGMHRESLRLKTVNGEIPGAKVGKSWVFIQQDLVNHIRSLYPKPASQGANRRSHQLWRYTKEVMSGGSASPKATKEYKEALGLTTNAKLSNTTIN